MCTDEFVDYGQGLRDTVLEPLQGYGWDGVVRYAMALALCL